MDRLNIASRLDRVVARIEERLKEPIEVSRLARDAGFSRAALYRLFDLVAGRPVLSYIRARRLSEAALEIRSGNRKLIEIALDYQYDSHEAFTRAFKAQFGLAPSAARENRRRLGLVRRLEIMKETQGQDAPCRVTEFVELKPMRVAACHVVGPEPEGKAWRKLSSWARGKGLPHEPGRAKVYGYNKPDRGANDDAKTHGYEVLLAVPDDVAAGGGIAIRTFPGGRYAAIDSTVRDVGRDWKRLALWLSTSAYEYDDRTQWLEEHVAMGRTEEEIRLKLLIPVRGR